MMTSLLAA
jgi:hypothetical protein